MRRCALTLLAVPGLTAPVVPCAANTPQKRVIEIVVRFERDAVALEAAERGAVLHALDRIRTEDWCAADQAIAFGTTLSSWEADSPTADPIGRRAAYVAAVLERHGFPPRNIVVAPTEVSTSPDSALSGSVIVIIEGTPPLRSCPYPFNGAGFRVYMSPSTLDRTRAGMPPGPGVGRRQQRRPRRGA